MAEQVFPGGIDLVPGPQGPPVPANGLRLVTIGGALYTTTDGITFTAAGGGGGGTIHTSAPLSGDGSVGTPATIAAGALPLTALATQAQATVVGNPTGSGTVTPVALTAAQLTALINAATGSLSGAITAVQYLKLLGLSALSRGADLTDANATVQPFTDAASLYVLKAGTLTANRTLTVGNVSGFGPVTVSVLVLDTSSFTYTIINSSSAGIALKAANAAPMLYTFYSGAGGAFTANVNQFANANQ